MPHLDLAETEMVPGYMKYALVFRLVGTPASKMIGAVLLAIRISL